MPAEGRLQQQRCARHPGSLAVGRCAGCDRALCLTCATLVRGQTYGGECLGLVLGPDAPPDVEPADRDPRSLPRLASGAAFAVATLATALPWSRFGPGSGFMGAWSRTGGWSITAGVAALLGLALSIARRRGWFGSVSWDVVGIALGAIVAISALLAVVLPPAFSRPWLGPWIAAAAGIVASSATIVSGRLVHSPGDLSP